MRFRTVTLILVLILVAGGSLYLLTSGRFRDFSHLVNILTGERSDLKTKNHLPHVVLEDTLFNLLRRMEIPDSAVSVRSTKSTIEIRTSVPRGEPVEVVIDRLSGACTGTSYHVYDCYYPANAKSCSIRYTSSTEGEPAINLTLLRSNRYFSKAARIVLVFTDFASVRSDLAEEYLDFPAPLAFAIVPTLSSAKLAERIEKQGDKTVLALLPMEPVRNIREEYRKARIMIDYSGDRLHSLAHAAFEKVPGCAGAINLGGTRALEDSRVMGILFSEVKDRHAFFIEQTAPRKSVAADVAQRIQLSFAEADHSIDSSLTEPQVREQLARYAAEAQRRGTVVITGAATENLLKVLKRDLPDLKKNGIVLDRVSELFNQGKDEE